VPADVASKLQLMSTVQSLQRSAIPSVRASASLLQTKLLRCQADHQKQLLAHEGEPS
jgi:hypothetical protein